MPSSIFPTGGGSDNGPAGDAGADPADAGNASAGDKQEVMKTKMASDANTRYPRRRKGAVVTAPGTYDEDTDAAAVAMNNMSAKTATASAKTRADGNNSNNRERRTRKGSAACTTKPEPETSPPTSVPQKPLPLPLRRSERTKSARSGNKTSDTPTLTTKPDCKKEGKEVSNR